MSSNLAEPRVPGMAAVLARMLSARQEPPPPYEAPPSYSAALALSPPPYTPRHSALV